MCDVCVGDSTLARSSRTSLSCKTNPPSGTPQLLLSSCGIQSVLQLCLQGLQLLSKIPLLLLSFIPGGSLRLQVFLELRNLSFQFSNLLQGHILLGSFFFHSAKEISDISMRSS